MAKLSPVPVWQIFDDNGVTVPGALLYTYEAGTSTPKATYTDHTGDTANPNPIVADAAARMTIWLGNGNYKFVLTDGENATLFDPDHIEGNVIWTKDYISATGGLGGITVVENLDELRALTDYDNDTVVFVEGYAAVADGGGGWFYFNTGSTATDNDGTIILPDTVPVNGRWYRFIDNEVNVRWFGAGDPNDSGLSDTHLQAAFDYAATVYKDVVIPEGTYRSDVTVDIKYPCTIKANGAIFEKITSYSVPVFTAENLARVELIGGRFNSSKILTANGCDSVVVKDCVLYGTVGTDAIVNRAITLEGCINSEIHSNRFYDCDTGVYVTSTDGSSESNFCDNVDIHNNVFKNSFRGHDRSYPTAITLLYAVNVKIHENHIADIVAGSMAPSAGAVGIYEEGGSVSKLIIGRNTIENNTDSGVWSGIDCAASSILKISGNKIGFYGTTQAAQTVAINCAITVQGGTTEVSGNICYRSYISVVATTSSIGEVVCSGNIVKYSAYGAINASATHDQNTKKLVVSNNIISDCGTYGIAVAQFYSCEVYNNKIRDINTSDSSSVGSRSGIYFSNCLRGKVYGNTIENQSGGHARYGIDFSIADYTTRWVYHSNSFTGMEVGGYNTGYSSFPEGSQWEVGDKVENILNGDIIPSGFECIAAGSITTDYEASQGASYVQYEVGEGGSSPIAPGDILGVSLQNGTVQWTVCNYVRIDTSATPDVAEIFFDDDLSAYMESGAIVYYRRWKNTTTQSVDLYVKGASDDGGTREIRVNGRRVLYSKTDTSSSIGLTLTTFLASDMYFVSSTNYDIAADSGRATALASAIETLPKGQIGVITSEGGYNTGINQDIVDAAAKVGLFKLMGTPTGSPLDYAYAAVFLGAYLGASYNNKSAIEVLQSYSAGCPDAIINVPVYNGGFASNVVNALTSGNPARSVPVVWVNGVDTTFLNGRISGKTGTPITRSGNYIAANYDGSVFEVTGTGTIYGLDNTGWVEGSMVTLLIISGSLSFEHNQSASGNSKPFRTITGSNIAGPALVNFRLMTADYGGGAAQYWIQC